MLLPQAPLKDKNDIKIFILYLLRNIGYPLDFNNINDIAIQDGFVAYFDFAECFMELLDAGHITEHKIEGVDYYSVSETGITVAENLQSSIMGIIREKSLKNAFRLLSFKKRGIKTSCSAEPIYEPASKPITEIIEEEPASPTSTVDGSLKKDAVNRSSGGTKSTSPEDHRYNVNIKISENNKTILSLSVTAESKAQAQRMTYNFNNRPETFYRGVIALLSGDVNYLFD